MLQSSVNGVNEHQKRFSFDDEHASVDHAIERLPEGRRSPKIVNDRRGFQS